MTESNHRERWSSRVAFILACMGAAIGFGNVWRFPSLVYKYGGGAFFVPYLLALFVIGIPMLVLEISLGQAYQTGDMGCFSAMHKRLRGVGLSSVSSAFFVVCYYCALITWTIRSFFETFGTNVFSDVEGSKGEEAYEYFTGEIIGMKTLPPDTLLPTRLVPENVGYLCLVWVTIFCCIAFGVKVSGRITYFTAGFPILLLFIFLIRSLTLEGAMTGVKAYIGHWDLSVLTEHPDCWSTACTQVFFSIGITFGVMTAFGSHCEKKAPAFWNSVIIAVSDSLFAIISGLAVFATVGYVAESRNVSIEELNIAGPGLLFGVYPIAMASLPNGIHWVRLLFVFMFLLGIDSGFALVEGVFTVAHDTVNFRHIARWKLALTTCITGFICGLLYVTDAGLIFLDVVDFYINFMMILVGFFECFAAGWMWDLDGQIKTLGKPIVFLYMCTTFISVLVASILWFAVENINNMLAGFVALIAIYTIGMSGVLYLCKQALEQNPEWTWTSILYDLALRNVLELREKLSESVGFLPSIWAISIKHVVPQLLLVLFINLAAAKNGSGQPLFGHYEGYLMFPYQFLGIMVVAVTLFILGLGLVMPSAYNVVAPPEGEVAAFEEKLASDTYEASDEDTQDNDAQDTLSEEITEAAVEVA